MTDYYDPIRKTDDAQWPTYKLARSGQSVTLVTGYLRDAVSMARRRDCDSIAVVDPRYPGEHVVWREGSAEDGGQLASLPYNTRV